MPNNIFLASFCYCRKHVSEKNDLHDGKHVDLCLQEAIRKARRWSREFCTYCKFINFYNSPLLIVHSLAQSWKLSFICYFCCHLCFVFIIANFTNFCKYIERLLSLSYHLWVINAAFVCLFVIETVCNIFLNVISLFDFGLLMKCFFVIITGSNHFIVFLWNTLSVEIGKETFLNNNQVGKFI